MIPIKQVTPRIGSYWRDPKDNVSYRVITITNTTGRIHHKPQVVYQDTEGNIYSKPLSGWPGILVQQLK